MISQLPHPIPLETPKGHAWAVAILDYGPQWDLLWVTFVHETGECWTFQNRDIRLEKNISFGILPSSPIDRSAEPINRSAMGPAFGMPDNGPPSKPSFRFQSPTEGTERNVDQDPFYSAE